METPSSATILQDPSLQSVPESGTSELHHKQEQKCVHYVPESARSENQKQDNESLQYVSESGRSENQKRDQKSKKKKSKKKNKNKTKTNKTENYKLEVDREENIQHVEDFEARDEGASDVQPERSTGFEDAAWNLEYAGDQHTDNIEESFEWWRVQEETRWLTQPSEPELPFELLSPGPALRDSTEVEVADLDDQMLKLVYENSDNDLINWWQSRQEDECWNTRDESIEKRSEIEIATALAGSTNEEEKNGTDFDNQRPVQQQPEEDAAADYMEYPKAVSGKNKGTKKKAKSKRRAKDKSKEMTNSQRLQDVNAKLQAKELEAKELETLTDRLRQQLLETLMRGLFYNPNRKYQIEPFKSITHSFLKRFALDMGLGEEIQKEVLEDYRTLKNKVVGALITRGQIDATKQHNILSRTFALIHRTLDSYGVQIDAKELRPMGMGNPATRCLQIADITIHTSTKAGLKTPVIKEIVDKLLVELQQEEL